MRRRLPLIVALLAAVSCGDEEKPGPEVQLRLPLELVRLEPNTRSRLAYVDWTVTTGEGTHTGQVAVAGTSEALRFDFPGDAQPTRIELKGYDAANRLRAGGVVDEAALSAATTENPAKLWFHLYDEFQAYPDTPRGLFQEGLSYLDTDGTVVSIGGDTPTESLRSVEAFDPETGIVKEIGTINERRAYFGFTRLSDGRYFLAGGGGGTNSNSSAEIWDPVSKTSTAVFSPLATLRSYHPSVFEIGSEVWVVGGTPLGGSRAADIFVGGDFVPSTTLFPPMFGALYFGTTAGGFVEVRAWNNSLTGDVFRSNTANAVSTFGQPAVVHFGSVEKRENLTIIWGSNGANFQCDHAFILPPSGSWLHLERIESSTTKSASQRSDGGMTTSSS